MISDQNETIQLSQIVGPTPNWMAFVSNDILRDNLLQIALRDGLSPAIVQLGNFNTARKVLSKHIEPRILIIDLTDSTDLIADAKKVVDIFAGANTHLLLIGNEDHISTLHTLKHLGIADYLAMPVDEAVLQHVIDDTLMLPAKHDLQAATVKIKPFTVVIGAKGGVGSSSVCINMAALLAYEFQKRVCIVDFDLYNGSIGILLDLVQNAGLNDALNEADRLDDIYLRRLLLQKDNNLYALTGQLAFEQTLEPNEEAIQKVITLLRDAFDFVFADIPATLNSPHVQNILALADNIIIVTDISLVAIQGILKLKTFLSAYMPHVKYKVLVNKNSSAKNPLSKQMFEKAINSSVDEELAFCKVCVAESDNLGDPFVKTHPNHEYTKCLRAFLSSIYTSLESPVKEKPSFFQQLWRKGK